MSDQNSPKAKSSDRSCSSPSTPRSSSTSSESSASASLPKALTAIRSLSTILPSPLPSSLSSSADPADALLRDDRIAAQITALLRRPDSGVGDDPLCRWLYDAFQTSDPAIQLVVLRFLPILAGVYLSRVALRNPLAGFEAVLLALYAHETTARGGQSLTVTVPDLSNPSIYHDTASSSINGSSSSLKASTELHRAVVSPSLEPHGTVRSTRRARIVGVALELYYSRVSQMPVESKVEFCQFCRACAGQDGEEMYDRDAAETGPSSGGGGRGGRISMPWELLQPVLRVLGHCILGGNGEGELRTAAAAACRGLYGRALHDVNARAILATQSLLKLGQMASAASRDEWDPTEIPNTRVISL